MIHHTQKPRYFGIAWKLKLSNSCLGNWEGKVTISLICVEAFGTVTISLICVENDIYIQIHARIGGLASDTCGIAILA